MSKARNIADLLDANGDVALGNLDNVPPADLVNDTSPQLGGSLDVNGFNVFFGDNESAYFGTGNDLQIYHNGSHSYITEAGTGNLTISGTNLNIQATDGSRYMTGQDGGYTRLWYAGTDSPKLETTSSGVSITGDLSVSGNIAGAGKVIGHAYVTNSTQVVRNAADYINLDSLSSSDGYTQMTLNYTPTKGSADSVLVVRSQSYTSEHNRNEDGGPTHALWLGSSLMGISLHGNEFYSAYQEGPSSANKMIQGFYSSHSAGTQVTAKVKLGNSYATYAKYYTTNYSTANTAQYSQKCGTTSWIEILEIAL